MYLIYFIFINKLNWISKRLDLSNKNNIAEIYLHKT